MVVIQINYYAFDKKSYFNINTFTLHSEKQGEENEFQLYARHRIELDIE